MFFSLTIEQVLSLHIAPGHPAVCMYLPVDNSGLLCRYLSFA